MRVMREQRLLVGLFVLVVVAVAMAACGSKGSDVAVPRHQIVAGCDAGGNVVCWLDGVLIANDQLTSHVKAALSGTESVDIVLVDKQVDGSQRWVTVPFTGGCVHLDVRLDNGGVNAPCFNKGRNHVNIHLRNFCNSTDLMNMHVTGWWSGGPQVGLYNSANRWCFTTQGSLGKLRDAIRNALLAAGLGWSAAVVVSEITAPAILPALAF